MNNSVASIYGCPASLLTNVCRHVLTTEFDLTVFPRTLFVEGDPPRGIRNYLGFLSWKVYVKQGDFFQIPIVLVQLITPTLAHHRIDIRETGKYAKEFALLLNIVIFCCYGGPALESYFKLLNIADENGEDWSDTFFDPGHLVRKVALAAKLSTTLADTLDAPKLVDDDSREYMNVLPGTLVANIANLVQHDEELLRIIAKRPRV